MAPFIDQARFSNSKRSAQGALMNHRTLLATTLLVCYFMASGHAQTTLTLNFTNSGKSRNAVVYVPAGVNKPPVVYFVHGYGGSGAGFANDTKGNKVADREKFIAIYPSAVGGSWNMQDTSDYPFLEALLDTVDRRYKVDRERVYCSGFSQGGFISNGVGYKHPEIFAAVAPVSGHIPSFSTAAPLKRPVPIFTTFGTNDVSDVASFMADINTWLKLNGCDKASRKTQRPYPASNPKSQIARTSYTCSQGSEVAYDSVITGQHEWAMDTVNKVNTTEEVWKFFKRFTLSGTSGVSPEAVSERHPISAIYRSGRVYLSGAEGIRSARVTNLVGSLLMTASVENGSFQFAGQTGGVYLVSVTGESGLRTVKVNVR